MVQEAAVFLAFAEKQSPEFVQAQAKLQRRLTKLFDEVGREINRQVKTRTVATNVQTLSAPISNAKSEFIFIIDDELKRAAFIPDSVKTQLKEQGETSVRKMLSRMQIKVAKIIEQAQSEGLSASDITGDLSKVFTTLRDSEIKTIARNEMNLANALKEQRNYLDSGIQYQQWSAIIDDVTRSSHEDLDGEIIRMGDTFSNGLRFPQDRNGPIEEWINCRCDPLPFIPPRGYFPPPGQEQFREDDLVKVKGLN